MRSKQYNKNKQKMCLNCFRFIEPRRPLSFGSEWPSGGVVFPFFLRHLVYLYFLCDTLFHPRLCDSLRAGTYIHEYKRKRTGIVTFFLFFSFSQYQCIYIFCDILFHFCLASCRTGKHINKYMRNRTAKALGFLKVTYFGRTFRLFIFFCGPLFHTRPVSPRQVNIYINTQWTGQA